MGSGAVSCFLEGGLRLAEGKPQRHEASKWLLRTTKFGQMFCAAYTSAPLGGTFRLWDRHINLPSADNRRTPRALGSPLQSAVLDKGFILGIVQQGYGWHAQSVGKQRYRRFACEVLTPLDVRYLIDGHLTCIRELSLRQSCSVAQQSNANPEVGLQRFDTFHISECGQTRFLMTPSITTGYGVTTLGFVYALESFAGPKSKKSRTGTPNAIEKTSIDSKDGAPTPRSIMLRKSTDIPRSSAKFSCVMPRSVRIERSFLPNNFRKVDTFRVWRNSPCGNTEYYYGLQVAASRYRENSGGVR